jgi:hypothetical protein
MITAPARQAPAGPAGAARHLDAIAAALAGCGIASRVTRLAGTPVLTTGGPAAEPEAATVTIDPDTRGGPALALDCTCIWTPARGASPQVVAATITAVLAAARPAGPAPPARRPPAADAARLASFLRRHPGWSAFWDKRYGLWRVSEDDPGSALYAETPDPGAVITYITARS